MKQAKFLCFAVAAASLGFAGPLTAGNSMLPTPPDPVGVVMPAAPLQLYYCGYCDGASLSFNGPALTAYGQQFGNESCPEIQGGIGGTLVYTLATPGIGVSFGYALTASYAQYGIASTEITFKPPKWRHLDFNGNVINQGDLCYTPQATAATNAPRSIDPQ